MNLLKMMKQEIAKLKLTDKLEILYYLYMRTGEIFDYDPSFMFSTKQEQDKLIERDKSAEFYPNIENITMFQIICYRWAYIMHELLKVFNIKSEVIEVIKEGNHHAYIKVTIDNEDYELDITNKYEDFMLIKLGLRVNNFRKVSNNLKDDKINQIEDKFYKKGIKSPELAKLILEKARIFKILKSVLIEKLGENDYHEEYNYQVFREIEKIINVFQKNLGYVSGAKGIAYLLSTFMESGYNSKKTYFFNKASHDFIEIHSMMHNGVPVFYAFHKTATGNYELQEVPPIYVESLKTMYVSKYIENLMLEDKSNSLVDELLARK